MNGNIYVSDCTITKSSGVIALAAPDNSLLTDSPLILTILDSNISNNFGGSDATIIA
jgi:hypothetical protein